MFKLNLINAWRNLRKNKVVSSINIIGLTIGLTCAIFAILFSYHELSFENCHANADKISKVYTYGKFGSLERIPVTYSAVAKDLQNNYPEIELTARARKVEGIVFQDDITPIAEKDILISDISIFNILTIPLVRGVIPKEPEEIVISEKMAKKYFNGNAVNEYLKIKINDKNFNFLVTGVFTNLPSNTHLKASFITQIAIAERLGWNINDYNSTSYEVYVLTNTGIDIKALNSKIAGSYKIPVDIDNITVALNPLKKIHLNDNLTQNAKGNLLTLLIGGIITLLLTCFNYMNLNTILFSTRTREIGICKTNGAKKFDIFKQFMTEAFLSNSISFGFSIIVILILLPYFNNLFETEIKLSANYFLVFSLLSAFIITLLLSGFYPALVLTKAKPITLIHKSDNNKHSKNRLMSTLITIQFIVAIMLLQFFIISFKQGNYISKYDVNKFDGNNVIVVNGKEWGDLNKVKAELLKNPQVESVSWSSRLPQVGMGMVNNWNKEGNQEMALKFWMESDYFNVFKIKLIEGRSFFESDKYAVIINKLTANSLGYENPVGKKMMMGGSQYEIIGVVDNFQAVPPVFQDMPLIACKSGSRNDNLVIRISNVNNNQTKEIIAQSLQKINPEFPIELKYYNDVISELTKPYTVTGFVMNIFTWIIIFNAMMGLFGLSFFISQRKNKEVGIRKIHGATIPTIMWRLGKGFVTKFIVAFCIASPLIFMGGSKFLSMFNRHIKIGPDVFITGGLITLTILFISVGLKITQSAKANPVEALRYE